MSSQHQRGDTWGCRRSFVKGISYTSSPLPLAYQWNPWTRLGSSVAIIAFLFRGVA
jgi:hypothetical protein